MQKKTNCAELSANWAQPLLSPSGLTWPWPSSAGMKAPVKQKILPTVTNVEIVVVCARRGEPCVGREPGFTPFCCLTCSVRIFSLPQFIFGVPWLPAFLLTHGGARTWVPPPQACEISLFLRRYSYLSFLHLHQLQSLLSHLCVIHLPLKKKKKKKKSVVLLQSWLQRQVWCHAFCSLLQLRQRHKFHSMWGFRLLMSVFVSAFTGASLQIIAWSPPRVLEHI